MSENKIKYITYQLFPSKRANTLQTIKNIKYFTKKTDVELIFPDRRQGSKEKQIDLELINDFYDEELNIAITATNHSGSFSRSYYNKLPKVLKQITYLNNHIKWSKEISKKNVHKEDNIFTRSIFILYFCINKCNKIIYECHQLTKLTKFLLKRLEQKETTYDLIFINENLESILIDLGLNKDRIHCLPSGYDEEVFKNDNKEVLRKKRGLSDNNIVYIFAGNLELVGAHRPLDKVLIEYLNLQKNKKIQNSKLYIFCEPIEKRKELVQILDQYGNNENVFINEYVSHTEIIKWMMASDIGLNPLPDNFFSNNFASTLKIVEYLRANLLLLGSNVFANSRFKQEGYEVLLFNNNENTNISDKLLEAYSFIRSGRKVENSSAVSQYSLQSRSNKILNIFYN